MQMTSPGPLLPRGGRVGAHRCHSELAILRFAHVRYIVVVEKRYAHAPRCLHKDAISQGGPIVKKLGMVGIIGGAALLTAVPFSLQWSQKNVALSLDSAEARIGRPLTATSVAGVHRRAYRRAYRSAVHAGAAGYGVGLYSGYGYPAYSGYYAPQSYSSYAPYSSPYSNYAPYSYSAPYRYGYSAPYLGYSAPYLGYSPYFGYTRAQRY
jgi:hypothetical protein